MKMNKREVLAEFKQEVKPVIEQKYGKGDKIALAEEWNNFTDYLQKEGRITEKQVNRWNNPF